MEKIMDDTFFNVKIGSRVKKLRIDKKMTQKELAEATMVSASSITRLEKGETMVSVFTIMEIARVFGVSVAELLSDTYTFDISEMECLIKKIEICPPEKRKLLIKGIEMIMDAFSDETIDGQNDIY